MKDIFVHDELFFKKKYENDKGCVWESLFVGYLSLFSHISTFNKNYRC